jgi:multidrug efflux pump subunit AcrB
VRLRDVARIELGALSYDHQQLPVAQKQSPCWSTQRPGSNALATAKNISKRTMTKLKQIFPRGLDYNIGYNPTEFIAQSVS